MFGAYARRQRARSGEKMLWIVAYFVVGLLVAAWARAGIIVVLIWPITLLFMLQGMMHMRHTFDVPDSERAQKKVKATRKGAG